MSNHTEPKLILHRDTHTIELIDFSNIDPNGIITFSFLPRGLAIFAGILKQYCELPTTLTNGKCNDESLFYLVDSWLEDSSKNTAYFIEVGKHYIEVRNSYEKIHNFLQL